MSAVATWFVRSWLSAISCSYYRFARLIRAINVWKAVHARSGLSKILAADTNTMNTCIVIDHGKPSAIGNRNLIVESTRLFEKRFFSNSIKGTREMRGESTIVTSEIFSFPPFRASRRACCLCYMCLSKKKKIHASQREMKKRTARVRYLQQATWNCLTPLISFHYWSSTSRRIDASINTRNPFTAFLRVANVGYRSHSHTVRDLYRVGKIAERYDACMQCDYEAQRVLWQSRMRVRVSCAFVLCLHTRNSIRYTGNSA